MQIAKLPEDVQSFIRTGVTITSISQCVVELVLNSLDAGASRVGVRIDLSKYELQVVDDGYGLNLEQLNLIGNRYMTSKCNTLADLQGNLKYYGYRGEAIASIKQVCDSLIIISKPKGENVTYSKVLKPNEDGNYKAVEAKLDRPGHGTTVVVINVFSNFPVRQKQLQHSLEIEQVKNELQTIALIQPQVSFTLRNDVTKSVILHTDKCTDIIQNFHQIFENEEAEKELIYVSVNEHNFVISAYISRETAKTKKLQFIYVNKRYVKKNKLYSFVNKQLKKSFYLKTVSCKFKHICSSGNLSGIDFDSADCKDDCAIFIINIECPYSEYDICLDPKKQLIEFKDWDLLFSCIEKCVSKYLQMEDDLHDFSNQDEQVKIVDEDTDKKKVVHERKINVNNGGISHDSLNLNDANCNTSAVQSVTVFKKDFQNDVMFSGSKKSIAHSEHILTECDECKTPYLLKGSNNVVMESNAAGDNNQSIIPVVCKDFYENNLLLLKHNFQLINKTSDNRMSYVTPMNIISNYHKNISVKELRKNGRYDNSCSTNRTVIRLKGSKNKKVRFNNNIVFIKKTNDNYLKKNIKCHKKENTIYNGVPHKSSENLTHQKGFFKPSYRIHSNDVKYKHMKKRIHCDGYNVSTNNFINNYGNKSQTSCAKSYENNKKNFKEYNNLNESDNCTYHKFNTAPKTSYVDSFCNCITNQKFLDKSTDIFLYKNKLPCDVKCYKCNLVVSSDVTEINNRESTPCIKTKDIKSHTNFYNKILVDDYTQTSCKDLPIDQVEISNYADVEVNGKSKDNEIKLYNTNANKCIINSKDFSNSNKMISKLNENKAFLQTDFLHSSHDDSTVINNNIRFKKKLLHFDISNLYKNVSVNNYSSRDQTNNFFNHNSRENLLLMETANGESNNDDGNDFMKKHKFKSPSKNNCSDHSQKTTEECFAKQSVVDSDLFNSILNDLSKCFEKLKIDNDKNDDIKMICTQNNFFTNPRIQSPCKEDSDRKREFEQFKNEDYVADPSMHYLFCCDKIDEDCSMIQSGPDHRSLPVFSHIRDEITVTENDKKLLYEEVTNDKTIIASIEKRKVINIDKDSSNGFNNFCGYGNTDFLFGNFGFNIKHVASKEKSRNNSVEARSANNIINDNVVNNNYGEQIVYEDNTNCNFSSKMDRNAKQNLCDLSSLSSKRKCLFEIDNEINSGSNNNKKICVHENFISKSLPNNCVDINSHKNSSVQSECTNKKSDDIMTGLQLQDEVICLKEHKLPSGKYIYIHTDSGMSFYSPPKEIMKHNISSRCSFLPKGISPLQNSYLNYISNKINYCLQEEEKKEMINIIKKNDDKYLEENGSPFLKWKDHKHIGYDGPTNFDSFFNKTSIKRAVPLFKTYSFSKEDLNNAKVVGLLDKKFIATVMSCSEEKLIVIFDQHAVDERIRYEHLFRSYKNNDDGSFCCVPINPPLLFSVNETKLEIINEFIETFYKIGLKFTISNKKVIVNSVPTCLYNRAEKENSGEAINKLLCLVNKLMDEQTEYIIKTGGIGMSVPDTLNSVISYEACRGAIKFGDDLSKTAAQLLIKQLSTCLMPFQCAHGRPVLTPVFSLG